MDKENVLMFSIVLSFVAMLGTALFYTYQLDMRRLDILETNGCVAHMVE